MGSGSQNKISIKRNTVIKCCGKTYRIHALAIMLTFILQRNEIVIKCTQCGKKLHTVHTQQLKEEVL